MGQYFLKFKASKITIPFQKAKNITRGYISSLHWLVYLSLV